MNITGLKTSIHPARFTVELGSGFILLFTLINFFDESGLLAALLPCLLVHELGHISAMLLFGAIPTKLSCTISGLSLDYAGDINEAQEMLVAVTGPVFGFAFSLLCSKLGRAWESDYLLMCAGIGFVLNIFNLLPAMSLDGGRILNYFLKAALGSEKALKIVRTVGLITVFALLASGFFFISRGQGFALFLAGLWLFVLQQNKYCK